MHLCVFLSHRLSTIKKEPNFLQLSKSITDKKCVSVQLFWYLHDNLSSIFFSNFQWHEMFFKRLQQFGKTHWWLLHLLLEEKGFRTILTQKQPTRGVAAYLVNTIGVLQPGIVHLLHVIGARPVQKRLRGHRCSVAPDWLKRPCGPCGGQCEGPLLADSLSRLGGGERTQPRRTSP